MSLCFFFRGIKICIFKYNVYFVFFNLRDFICIWFCVDMGFFVVNNNVIFSGCYGVRIGVMCRVKL